MTGEPAAPPAAASWDLLVRPHRSPYAVYAVAAVVLIAHVAVGFALKIGSTGVIFQTADQVAMALLGLILAGVILLFARPRLRVGARGMAVRNLLTERVVPWDAVVGVSFPAGARWARIDLPDDEYVPAMAIQAVDGERAVVAMDQVRALIERYRGVAGPLSGRSAPS